MAAAALRRLTASGRVSTLVVANPVDSRKGMGAMSCLAPWLAARRRAAMLLTNEEGDNVPAAVAHAREASADWPRPTR